MSFLSHSITYAIGLLVVLAVRLAPHPPNVEPIMATMMPFAKRGGWFSGMLFCLLAILGFDFLTGTLGIWSLVTAGTYAFLGIVAGFALKGNDNKIRHYVLFAILGTLFYDAVTGIGMGMLLFDQPFLPTVLGQIPFTLWHLSGNMVLSIVLSPALYRWVVSNPKFTPAFLVRGWAGA